MLQIDDWKSFYDSLTIDIDNGNPVPKPTFTQLEAFERSNFQLPNSYKNFVTTFGPGIFSASLRFAAPGYSHLKNPTVDLANAHEAYSLTKEDIASFPLAEQEKLASFYYFGGIDERDWLAWDINDIRSPNDSEYAIYRVSLTKLRMIATSFKELVEIVCDRLFAPNPDWDEEEMGAQRSFSPATL